VNAAVVCVQVTASQLSLLEATMAKMERVAVWSLMSGGGSGRDVFTVSDSASSPDVVWSAPLTVWWTSWHFWSSAITQSPNATGPGKADNFVAPPAQSHHGLPGSADSHRVYQWMVSKIQQQGFAT